MSAPLAKLPEIFPPVSSRPTGCQGVGQGGWRDWKPGTAQEHQATPGRPAEAVRAAVGSGGAGSCGCVPGQLSKPGPVHRGRGTEPGACSACGALEAGVAGMRFTQPRGTSGKSVQENQGEIRWRITTGIHPWKAAPGITSAAQW